ncbi:MAG TPA: V-type ATP synthase subunit F [Candidatus Tetragenococcus pullicola]|nr:V-type ATP synthase subunit F [Candidatus Tetragenococcus pullicola]
MNYKIGVIGDKESVLPFKLFGFTVHFANETREINEAFNQLIEKEYGVIYITENCASKIMDRIASYQSKMIPAILLIPDHEGSRGIAQSRLEESMRKAAGQNLL